MLEHPQEVGDDLMLAWPEHLKQCWQPDCSQLCGSPKTNMMMTYLTEQYRKLMHRKDYTEIRALVRI